MLNDPIPFPPDWKEVLTGPRNQLAQYAYASRNWPTCALGEARLLYPNAVLGKAVNGGPLDRRLNRLGVRFDTAVRKGHRQKAIGIYKAIHARILTIMLGGAR